MRKIAVTAAWLLAGAGAWAQPQPATRVYTQPAIPTREALDRLNLQLAWRTYLPVASPKRFEERVFEAFTERIPPVGTRVEIILEPVPEKK